MQLPDTSRMPYEGRRNRIGRRGKWPKKRLEEEVMGGKSREEGENVR